MNLFFQGILLPSTRNLQSLNPKSPTWISWDGSASLIHLWNRSSPQTLHPNDWSGHGRRIPRNFCSPKKRSSKEIGSILKSPPNWLLRLVQVLPGWDHKLQCPSLHLPFFSGVFHQQKVLVGMVITPWFEKAILKIKFWRSIFWTSQHFPKTLNFP